MTSKKDNETWIVYLENSMFEKIVTFGYIEKPERYCFLFSNGSCLGYLPSNSKNNFDTNHVLSSEFVCFYVNAHNGEVQIIDEALGWDFHIISYEGDKKIVLISPKEKARLLLINEAGVILNEIEFTIDFAGEGAIIKKINDTLFTLEISNLENIAFYEIDLEKNTAKLIGQDKSNYSKYFE